MNVALLWLAALEAPLVWGYLAFWLMERLWPPRSTRGTAGADRQSGSAGGEHIHYEI